MAVAFSTTSDALLSRPIDNFETNQNRLTDEHLMVLFELNGCCKWIAENKFCKVALQFSDNFLRYSAYVSQYISSHTKACSFILADTSYGSCCVDEVAAEHYNADSLIHFGHSCLSHVRRLKVLHIFCNKQLNVKDCIDKTFSVLQDKSSNVIVLADVAYQYSLPAICKELSNKYKLVIESHLEQQNCTNDLVTKKQNYFQYFGRWFTLPGCSLSDCTVLYIGPESMALTNWMMTLNKCPFYSYNPVVEKSRLETVAVNRILSQRYFLVEKAKDAQIIGILVGTLGVSDYMTIIKKLKEMIKVAGKKYYTFSMGKINVAKLANFMEVDVYVLVSCAESIILNVKEYYQPIVTPFEMEIACNSNREWQGEYVSDFRDLLKGGNSYIPLAKEGGNIADVSLITGRLRRLGVDEEVPTDKTLAVVHGNRVSAQDILNERSWKGLNNTTDDTPVEKAKPGRKGIAISYTHETNTKND